jgi:hypothetical protein
MVQRHQIMSVPSFVWNFLVSLRSRWVLLSLIHLTALVHLAVYLSQPDKEISQPLQALSLAIVLLALAVFALMAWLNDARVQRFRARLEPLSWPITLSMLALLAVYGITIRPEWIYAHLALVLVATTANVVVTFFNNPLPIPRRWQVGLLLLILTGVVCVRAYSLSTYPIMNEVDEPWGLSRDISVARTGHVTDLLMLGVNGDPTYYQSHWAVPIGLWLRALGATTLWHVRLFHLLVMLVIMLVTALAARNLYGSQTALFTGAAIFSSAIAFLGLRARHDIGLALALACSIWLFSVALQRRQNRLHFLAGLVMGLGMFAHYHALLIAPAVALALYLPHMLGLRGQNRPASWGNATFYAVGVGVGFAAVVAVQVLPDVQMFLAMREPRNPTTFKKFLQTVLRHLDTLSQVSQWETLLIYLGLITAILRHQRRDWTLAALFVFCHLALGAGNAAVFDYHVVPLVPIYGLLIGAMLANGIGLTLKRTRFAALVIGFCALMPGLGATVDGPLRYLLSRQPVFPPAPPVAAWIRQNLPPDTTILGEHLYYLWLQDYRYASPYIPEFTPPAQRARYVDPMDQWDDMGIDVIILDPASTSWGLFSQFVETDYLQTRHFERIATFPGRGQTIEVWQRAG